MNILLINHYAGSPKHGMEYRPYYLAKEWIKKGHQVTIIGASRSHLRSKEPEMLGDLTKQEIDNINYFWLKTPSYKGNGIRRAVNMLVFIVQIFRFSSTILNGRRPDVVIASSTYPLDIFPAKYLARKCQARLVYEVHDLWPLSPVELGGMSKWHPFVVVMQLAENYAYRTAGKVISMLPNASEHMRNHGMSIDKYVYIPNGVDVAEWDKNKNQSSSECEAALRELNGKFIVAYAGAHGVANALYSLVEAARIIENENVAVVFVGQGPEKEKLQQMVSQKELSNVWFLPAVPKTMIPRVLEAMDVLYIGLQRQSLFRFGISPNKLFDYMMAGKPVIQAIESSNDLVAESGCGISVQPENSKAIAEAVMKLYNMTDLDRKTLGANGKRYVQKHHDYRVLATAFLRVLEMLCKFDKIN